MLGALRTWGAHASRRVIGPQSRRDRRLVEAAQNGQLVGDGRGLHPCGDEILSVGLHVGHRTHGRVVLVVVAPRHPRADLRTVASDRVRGRVSIGHINPQELRKGAIKIGDHDRRHVHHRWRTHHQHGRIGTDLRHGHHLNLGDVTVR